MEGVIPLAAVLSGKDGDELIRRLIDEIDEGGSLDDFREMVTLLGNVLADEPLALPETVKEAIARILKLGSHLDDVSFIRALAKGRYGDVFHKEAVDAFCQAKTERAFTRAAHGMIEAVFWRTVDLEDAPSLRLAANAFSEAILAEDIATRCEGLFGTLYTCYLLSQGKTEDEELRNLMSGVGERLVHALDGDPRERYAASWALVWFGACRLWRPPVDLLAKLVGVFSDDAYPETGRMALWALASQPLRPRIESDLDLSVTGQDILMSATKRQLTEARKRNRERIAAAIIVGWYVRRPWSDNEIAQKIREFAPEKDDSTTGRTLRELLEVLEDRPMFQMFS